MASRGWRGHPLDVKSTFLNSTLKEPVFLEQPEGYKDVAHQDWVLKLNKAIYGLKQSPCLWNRELHSVITSFGLTQSKHDPTLCFRSSSKGLVGAITVHVNDMCIVGNDTFVEEIVGSISARFDISSNEELHHFLSISITRNLSTHTVYLSQLHYIRDLVAHFLGGQASHQPTPTSPSFKDLSPLTPDETSSPGPYSSLVGALLWVA